MGSQNPATRAAEHEVLAETYDRKQRLDGGPGWCSQQLVARRCGTRQGAVGNLPDAQAPRTMSGLELNQRRCFGAAWQGIWASLGEAAAARRIKQIGRHSLYGLEPG